MVYYVYRCKTYTPTLYQYAHYPFIVGYLLRDFVAVYFLYCKIQYSWCSLRRAGILNIGH